MDKLEELDNKIMALKESLCDSTRRLNDASIQKIYDKISVLENEKIALDKANRDIRIVDAVKSPIGNSNNNTHNTKNRKPLNIGDITDPINVAF